MNGDRNIIWKWDVVTNMTVKYYHRIYLETEEAHEKPVTKLAAVPKIKISTIYRVIRLTVLLL